MTGATGLAALGGWGGTAAAAEANTGSVHVVGGGESATHSSIQTAHDDLTGEGGQIVVLDDYDESNDSFPVELSKMVHVEGISQNTTIDVPDDETGFRITARSFHRSVSMTRLRLEGGAPALHVDSTVFVHVKDVFIAYSGGDAVVIESQNDATSHLNYFDGVEVYGGEPIRDEQGNARTANGFVCTNRDSADPRTHATVFDRCTATSCRNRGFVVGGAASALIGCTSQYNGSSGVRIKDSNGVTVRDCYFEQNHEDADTHQFDVFVADFQNQVNGATIEGCYFKGHTGGEGGYESGPRNYAINVNGGSHSTTIANNHFTGYHSAVRIVNGVDTELCRSSHFADLYQEFLYNEPGSETRTRDNGVVVKQDLGDVDGSFDGDRGVHDGSGDAPVGLAIWDTETSAWVSMVDGEPIRESGGSAARSVN